MGYTRAYSDYVLVYSADVPDHARPVLLFLFFLTAGLHRNVLRQWNILVESLTSLRLSARSEMALLSLPASPQMSYFQLEKSRCLCTMQNLQNLPL